MEVVIELVNLLLSLLLADNHHRTVTVSPLNMTWISTGSILADCLLCIVSLVRIHKPFTTRFIRSLLGKTALCICTKLWVYSVSVQILCGDMEGKYCESYYLYRDCVETWNANTVRDTRCTEIVWRQGRQIL